MRRLIVLSLLCVLSSSTLFAQSGEIAAYSMYELYSRKDATLIRAEKGDEDKENEEKYVLRIMISNTQSMYVVLGNRGDAIVTLKEILDRKIEYRVLFKLNNPTDNMAGYFLKRSNATNVVRFYEGMNLNIYGEVSQKQLKRILKRLEIEKHNK